MNAAKFYEPILGPVLAPLRQTVIEIAKLEQLQKGDIFLDCCCGAGGLFHLAKKKHIGTLLGLDLSWQMLNEARKNAPEAIFLQADATNLPLPDKSIAVASVCMALHAMPLDLALKSLLELKRVAKRSIIVDYCLAERNITIPATYLAKGVEFLVGGEHYNCYKNFMHQGALEALVNKADCNIALRKNVLGGAAVVLLLV